MDASKLASALKKEEEKQLISPYLQGFYQKSIPWWPFIVFSILVAFIIGIATNFDLGFPPALIPVGIIAIFITILIIQKPEIGAYLLIISVFTNISDILTDRGLPAINRPLIAITIGSVFLNYYLKTGSYNNFPKISKPEWTIIAYYMAIVLSLMILPDKDSAFSTISDITKDILVGASVYITLNTQERWKKGIIVLISTVTVLAAMGVFKTITGSSITFFDMARNSLFGQVGETNELRYGGPIGEPNLWGQVLVSTLPFIFYLMNSQPLKRFLSFVVSGVLILLATIFTSSRGAFVALILISPLIAAERKIRISSFLVGVVLFAGLLVVLPDTYSARFSTLFSQDTLAQDESISGRSAAMEIGLEMFIENPILGVGFGKYRSNYWQTAEKLGLEANANNVNYAEDAQSPHSLYIEILSETGIVGLFTFLLYIYTLFSGLYKIHQKFIALPFHKEWVEMAIALSFSIATFLISGFFLHGVFFRFIWILLGLAMAATSISEQIESVPFVRQKPTYRSNNIT
jgi:O-antigen ligase